MNFLSATYNVDFDGSKALFSVNAGGYRLLKDFNVSLSSTVYDGFKTLLREFCINFEPDQPSLNITFTPSKDGYAFINGIEIMSIPTNLYLSAQGDGASYHGSDTGYDVENNTALEMIYRINVGGNLVSPNKDTGMYRTWNPTDEFYLDDLSRKLSNARQNFNSPLNLARIPNYTAPEQVYQTGRTMGGNSTTNKSYNLTWGFPVDPNYSYLVRLHFCEIDPNITAAGERRFQIFIANLTAEPNADVIGWTTEGKGNGIPIYKDYLVSSTWLGTQKESSANLFLALQANQDDYLTQYNDAILNGLEIFKLNDTEGNLGGPIPAPQLNIPPNVTSESSREWKKKRGGKPKDSNSSKATTKWGPFSFSTTKSTKSRGSSLPSELCRHFSVAEIKAATQNFNHVFIIGVGGFGNVYKGYIDDGSIPVAIKRLKPESSQGAHEFKTETEMLSQLRHLHLVPLV
ncbi:hypothetical protein ACLB2K_067725 [Fragaria x ananassa]